MAMFRSTFRWVWISVGAFGVAVALCAGPLERVPDTTLQLATTRTGTNAYRLIPALDDIVFTNPVAVAHPPGETNRLFVVERAGRILLVKNLQQPQVSVFLDLSFRVNSDYKNQGAEGLTGLAFHPGYASNGFFFVVYSTDTVTAAGEGRHNRLSRFERARQDEDLGSIRSERALITQLDEGYGHNFNDLAFGPDGYLYVAVGDEGESHDQFQNSQRIDKDFFSAILRIDVDEREGSLPPNSHPAVGGGYAIPPDNPFVGSTSFLGAPAVPDQVRTEFYAVGFRNPWRLAFDPIDGVLYCGDVGQHAAEEINRIRKGGNYGWAFREATLPGFRGDPPPGTTFDPPWLEYRHGFGPMEGKSVTAGLVYRGKALPELYGSYLFADYVGGGLWAARADGRNSPQISRLLSDPGIAAFGLDPATGEVLVVDHEEGLIKRLVGAEEGPGAAWPPALSDAGIFRNLETLEPYPGIVPYDVNLPFWSDHAIKRRWFSVPEDRTIGFRADGPWSFPEGMVWIKHFDLEMVRGDPGSVRRIETRVLVRDESGIHGATYRWGGSMTNAVLVPESGMDESFEIMDGGIMRTQVWHYPSRAECLVCHTSAGGLALGFNTAQLNRAFDYGDRVTNQIVALSEAGYFDGEVRAVPALPALAHPSDEAVSLEYRARSYLEVNCAYCHQPGGSGAGTFDARLVTPTSMAGLIGGRLVDETPGSEMRVIQPSSPDQSMIVERMKELGQGRMPPLGSSVPDSEGIALLSAWITNGLAGWERFEEWQSRVFGSPSAQEAAREADPDQDGTPNELEYLLGYDPMSDAEYWRLEIEGGTNLVVLEFPRKANRAFEVQVSTNLSSPALWEPLNHPLNRRFFSSTNEVERLEVERGDEGARYYRVRIKAP